MWCTHCGAQLEENANFCHNCGAPCDQEIQENQEILTEKKADEDAVGHCAKCGAPLFPNDAFCNQCGSPAKRAQIAEEKYQCPKCKTEYLPGAQFCSACGTPLRNESAKDFCAQDNPILIGLKQVPGFIGSYFRQPVATTKTVVQDSSRVFPVILFIVYVVSCGIYLFSILQSICDIFQGLLQNMFGMFAATFLMEAPLLTSLIFGVLYGSIFVLLLSLSLFSCTKLLHEDCSLGAIIRTTVVQSFIPSLLLLASAVLTLLSPWLGVMLLFLSQITWVILMVLGLSTLSSRSQSGRFWYPLIGLLFAAFLIVNLLAYKTSWQLVKNITISYDGESMTISEIMESEGMTEAGDFFEAVLGDLF